MPIGMDSDGPAALVGLMPAVMVNLTAGQMRPERNDLPASAGLTNHRQHHGGQVQRCHWAIDRTGSLSRGTPGQHADVQRNTSGRRHEMTQA